MRQALLLILPLLALALPAGAQARPAPSPQSGPGRFTTSLPPEALQGRQAVVETTRGTFVIELLAEVAPNHVGYFIERARDGAFDGTTFHRAVRHGIIQGGDPLSRDPGKRAQYGTGGLGVLAAELSDEPVSRGAVAAVLQPGRPDSAGAQFFVAVTDQPALSGQYTVFGRVVEGLEVVQAISEAPVDEDGRLTDRIEMTTVTIREAPPPAAVPFSTETVAELAEFRAVIETSLGPITLAFNPEVAPEHVRNFLRLADAGVYDGTSVHRVVRGFIIQTGMTSTRAAPLTQVQERHVRLLEPEFSATPHVAGTVSMARLDDPSSASTSFFICTAPAPTLDGKYTVFARVVAGMDVVAAIEAVPLEGDAPVERIELSTVRVIR